MNNSRARKRQRRLIALENRKTQLEGWKKTPVNDEFTKERKRQKILRAENDIKILEARI